MLVSPAIAPTWKDSPPMWLAAGEEKLADGSRLIVQQAFKDGTTVMYEEYEKLPHIFPILLPDFPQTALVFKHWAEACIRMAGKSLTKSSAIRIMLELATKGLDISRLVKYSKEQALDMLKKKKDARIPITKRKTERAST